MNDKLAEAEFLEQSERMMARIEQALDDSSEDFDWEIQPGGVIEITCDDDSKVIINRHTAAREIWIAARSGGFHYRFDATQALWLNTRDGEELFTALNRVLTLQQGSPVNLS